MKKLLLLGMLISSVAYANYEKVPFSKATKVYESNEAKFERDYIGKNIQGIAIVESIEKSFGTYIVYTKNGYSLNIPKGSEINLILADLDVGTKILYKAKITSAVNFFSTSIFADAEDIKIQK